MKIGVDLDNTTVTFNWRRLYNDYFDADVPLESTGWDDLVTQTHFENGEAFFDWFARAGGWDDMPWELGARGGIDELLDAGHIVEFITARGQEAREATLRWHASSPWAKSTRVTLRADKWSIPCSVYIDDSPHTITGLFVHGKNVIIYDQPWNQELNLPVVDFRPGELMRARGWHDVVSFVRKMQEPLHV